MTLHHQLQHTPRLQEPHQQQVGNRHARCTENRIILYIRSFVEWRRICLSHQSVLYGLWRMTQQRCSFYKDFLDNLARGSEASQNSQPSRKVCAYPRNEFPHKSLPKNLAWSISSLKVRHTELNLNREIRESSIGSVSACLLLGVWPTYLNLCHYVSSPTSKLVSWMLLY